MDSFAGGKRVHASYDDEAPEHNGRQKKRTNVDQDPGSEDNTTEYRILCPSSKIGGLIGKAGARIKALRLECRSKIKVEDAVPGSDERVIYICSTSTKDARLPWSLCPAQEALLRVHARTAAEDEDEGPVTARLLVPHIQIGCLLGKGGRIIEQMRREIPCQIRVMPKDQLPACALDSDELVQLSGDPLLVEKALRAISSRLYENPLSERAQGDSFLSQEPTNMLPLTAGGGLYSSAGYNGSLLGPTSVGASMLGMGGYSYGSYGGTGLGGGWSSIPVPPIGSGVPHIEGGTEEELSVRFLCPNEKIGSVIGKGGSVIRKMRDETQARIQVCDPIPDADERVIEITSTEVMESYASPGIDAALLVHRRLIELQTEKDKDNNSFTVRLLVPTSNIGCLLGKGGSIITEMRKATRANIRIPPKEGLPKCANDTDDLVQIMGDEHVVHDALLQVLRRLRANLFKGHEGAAPSFSSMAYGGSNPMPSSYGGGRLDAGVTSGGLYPLTNVGYGMDYGAYGVSAGVTKRRQRQS